MADRPIIFSAPMVQALLAGRKSQTRRVLKPQPDFRGGVGDYHDAEEWGWEDEDGYHVSVLDICPNGFRVGDRLWVREAVCWVSGWGWRYRADNDDLAEKRETGEVSRWRPSIHMPRWASRLTLTVTDVRVQRLADLTDEDAIAEGCDAVLALTIKRPNGAHPGNPRECYCDLWNSLHGPGAWDANPWVVAVTFTVQRWNIDQIGDANG